jgi:hypothetical protein
MQTAALILVIAASLWLVGVGALMALRPGFCLDLCKRMTASLEASNWRLNVTEQGLRIVAGVALVLRAPASKLPLAFAVAGWVLAGTSVVILVMPVRWHGAYGRLWVDRIPLLAIRLLAPVPVLAGAWLIYTAL